MTQTEGLLKHNMYSDTPAVITCLYNQANTCGPLGLDVISLKTGLLYSDPGK